ncbi:glycosyltransferase family 4 protein [Mariprofundus ferrooxydans]|uniref:glycosyltransferase family 4 protein n=1 Tax=Mariprofundus ferrooxydans TaxID=314344 RepID=UPI001431144F|nr:glycosyltransferase family 4 protein [Mariprofundus ferrooxydans]
MSKTALILYPSATAACGIGTWLEALSVALQEHGWDVTVGLARGAQFHDPARVEAFRPSLKTIRMDARTGTEEGRIQAIERAVLSIKPDVVIVNVLDSAFEAVRRLRYRGHEFRLVAANHGNLPVQAACLLQHRDVIDMAVCVSRLSYLAMAAQADGFIPERLKHIANAVAVPELQGRSAAQPFRVGYAGRLDGDKRSEDILPFFTALHHRCPDAQMWVAGKGESGDEMVRLAASYPDHFSYCGEMSRAQLDRDFYPALNVLVHFSPSEAWGYSIAEGMSHGVVPVTSAFRGIDTDGLVLEGSNALVFPVGDTTLAADMVAGLYQDRERLGRMAAAAATHIAGSFSLPVFGRSWSDALDQCLQMPALPLPARPASLDARGPASLPWPLWERCRKFLGMRVAHASAGEEWPHFKCSDPRLIQSMEQALNSEAVKGESVKSGK